MVATLPRRAANAVLALWVCVTSTSTAVAHTHVGGDRAHSHHLGLAPLADPAPADTTPLGAAVPHWHLILLGVESGGLPVDAGDRDAPPLDAHAAAVGAPDLGAPGPDRCADPAPLPIPDLIGPYPGPPPAAIEPPPGGSPPTAPALRSTCPKAALARSGVRIA